MPHGFTLKPHAVMCSACRWACPVTRIGLIISALPSAIKPGEADHGEFTAKHASR